MAAKSKRNNPPPSYAPTPKQVAAIGAAALGVTAVSGPIRGAITLVGSTVGVMVSNAYGGI